MDIVQFVCHQGGDCRSAEHIAGCPGPQQGISQDFTESVLWNAGSRHRAPNDLAAKAMKLRHIWIRWVNCCICGREDVPRCYRCWSPGHVSACSKGPD
ncbi:unnamed protein product [Trichogramma brassicae]|uniref:Uncharacterized protein n=1 Tax=Trichogramma brassicae TaxID=86971 RepID=A0A6H5ILH0_9HYME|nr:unnamed protein product [Trichogramma brassicae]